VPIEVTMPKLSPTMETGIITQWLVKVGDQVKEGDVLADIETDKATMQMKSYEDGTIVHIDHAAGEEVALGERVLVLARKGEDAQQIATSLTAQRTKPASAGSPAALQPRKEPANQAAGPGAAPSLATRQDASGNGPQAPGQALAAADEPAAGRAKASPLARRMAESANLDLTQVRGSGPGGRIIRRDIEAILEHGAAQAPAGAPGPAPPAPPQSSVTPVQPAPGGAARPAPAAGPHAGERIPHSRMRKTIAQRMMQTKQTVPEIHLNIESRVDRLIAAREELNKRLSTEGIKLSLGDFVTKAVATALRAHPALNASFEPDAIVRHAEINLGIAVALPEGLIVPVLKRADLLGLREIRRQTEALAAAARNRSLTGDQLSGGTFTISNLGMYGIHQFDAIINLPEVAILAVGAAERRPVAVGDGLVAGSVMSLTLTADHRAVDGATGAEFLRTLGTLLEEPAAMLL
jgi:pyruvate dehydrogenase E2 component (dihydrolipoamide acetyltransferase)